jgi:hypothetical protein
MLVYESPVALGRAQQPEPACARHNIADHPRHGMPIHRGQPALEIAHGMTHVGHPIGHLAQRVLAAAALEEHIRMPRPARVPINRRLRQPAPPSRRGQPEQQLLVLEMNCIPGHIRRARLGQKRAQPRPDRVRRAVPR